MKIMSVDDSSTMRKIIATVLNTENYEIIPAENGQDALDKLSGVQPDVFIVDINMPVMGGVEFITRLRQKPEFKKTPVVILTTESEQDMIAKGKEAGANAWIVKPFESDDLIELIRHFEP